MKIRKAPSFAPNFTRLNDPPTAMQLTPRLLLVDDDPRLLRSLAALLDGQGYELTNASGGHEAIAMLTRLHYDLVLLDLRMPGVSGHDVMDFINEHDIDTDVIVLSGDNGIEAAIGAINRRAYGYLRKPYQHNELLTLVRNALERRRMAAENRDFARRLERSEKLYRFLIDSSPDIIYTLDPEGRFTYINRRVTELLGFPREQLIGASYTAIVHDDDIDRARYVFNERRVGERASRNVELRLKCIDPSLKERTFETSLRTISFNSIGMYLSDNDGVTEYSGTYGIARDVTEKRRIEEVIAYQAYHDILTDLPNRALLRDRLELAIIQSRRKEEEIGLMFVDLDRFKAVNDSLGHLKGDELLRQVAARLKSCIRKGDTLARVGGDEFVVLLPELRERGFASIVAQKFLQVLSAPFVLDNTTIHISASIGIAVFPEDGEKIDDLMRHADMAMYKVKAEGKNAFSFYDRSLVDAAHDKVLLEQDLRRGFKAGELEMFYQPQVDGPTGKIIGAEALMRWNHPQRGLLVAGDFLPLAEEVGLMVPLSDWMVESVCRDVRFLRDQGKEEVRISINLSPTCLMRDNFFRTLSNSLDIWKIPGEQIEVEITENICIRNPEAAIQQLKKLQGLGTRIAIDDFGTGYSSLAYLQRFPVDTLKIDRSFISEIGHDGGHFPVVLAVVAIASGLSLDLVAEGVESATQADYLEQAGCRIMQGYHFHKPMQLEQFADLLQMPASARRTGAG
jgi:diguanylate cyclase (GGDEF)-like protein/PAS domain S-box-containing protein